jgi:hypothetical protein
VPPSVIYEDRFAYADDAQAQAAGWGMGGTTIDDAPPFAGWLGGRVARGVFSNGGGINRDAAAPFGASIAGQFNTYVRHLQVGGGLVAVQADGAGRTGGFYVKTNGAISLRPDIGSSFEPWVSPPGIIQPCKVHHIAYAIGRTLISAPAYLAVDGQELLNGAFAQGAGNAVRVIFYTTNGGAVSDITMLAPTFAPTADDYFPPYRFDDAMNRVQPFRGVNYTCQIRMDDETAIIPEHSPVGTDVTTMRVVL